MVEILGTISDTDVSTSSIGELLLNPKKKAQYEAQKQEQAATAAESRTDWHSQLARDRIVFCPFGSECHAGCEVPVSWLMEDHGPLPDIPGEFSIEFDKMYQEQIKKEYPHDTTLFPKTHYWVEHRDEAMLLMDRYQARQSHKDTVYWLIKKFQPFLEFRQDLQRKLEKIQTMEKEHPDFLEARKQVESEERKTVRSIAKYLTTKNDE